MKQTRRGKLFIHTLSDHCESRIEGTTLSLTAHIVNSENLHEFHHLEPDSEENMLEGEINLFPHG